MNTIDKRFAAIISGELKELMIGKTLSIGRNNSAVTFTSKGKYVIEDVQFVWITEWVYDDQGYDIADVPSYEINLYVKTLKGNNPHWIHSHLNLENFYEHEITS